MWYCNTQPPRLFIHAFVSQDTVTTYTPYAPQNSRWMKLIHSKESSTWWDKTSRHLNNATVLFVSCATSYFCCGLSLQAAMLVAQIHNKHYATNSDSALCGMVAPVALSSRVLRAAVQRFALELVPVQYLRRAFVPPVVG